MSMNYWFSLGYITNVLEDARVYSEHAQKKELDVSDVKLAVQTRMDHSFTTPPPRDVSSNATSKYEQNRLTIHKSLAHLVKSHVVHACRVCTCGEFCSYNAPQLLCLVKIATFLEIVYLIQCSSRPAITYNITAISGTLNSKSISLILFAAIMFYHETSGTLES